MMLAVIRHAERSGEYHALLGGEGGITPALGDIVNAIVDAVGDLGVTHLEMPVTPERVWRATRRQV
jgi:CO/xanthine dehydrogenase Mo-binding subunit